MSKTVPFQTIQFSTSTQFKWKYTVWLSKTFLFQAIQFNQTVLIHTIQFSISMQLVRSNPLIGHLSDATTPDQSGPGSHGNKGFLRIPQSSSITGTSPSDCSVSYTGHTCGGLTPLQRCSRCILQPTPTGQRSIWLVSGAVIDTTTLGPSGPRSNGNENVTSYCLELQNRTLTAGCSLMSYLELTFLFF